MQRETEIGFCPVKIIESGRMLQIGGRPDRQWFINKDSAPALIEFIQAWLDHDPEQELRAKVDRLRLIGTNEGGNFQQATNDIIAAVREHDAKYRKDV